MVWYGMVSMHNGGNGGNPIRYGKYGKYSKYNKYAEWRTKHRFTYELAPCPFFLAGSEHADRVHRTMHIYYFKVCHLQARTLKDASGPKVVDTIPWTSREILYTFGRRSTVDTVDGLTRIHWKVKGRRYMV